MTDSLSSLPFYESLWIQYEKAVPLEKRSETGLGVLGLTASAGPASAFYLIKVGTKRWAMNRRIGVMHQYFAEAIVHYLQREYRNDIDIKNSARAFLRSTYQIFEEVGELHKIIQDRFESVRIKCHAIIVDNDNFDALAEEISIDMLIISIMCLKEIYLSEELEIVANKIMPRIEYYSGIEC